MSFRRREILDLLHLLKGKAPDRLLNEAVRKVKLKEAEALNHAGFRRQLDFLIGKRGLDDTRKLVKKLLDEHKEVAELARTLHRRRKLSDLVRCLYHYKACEADRLAMGDLTAQVRFIRGLDGGRDRLLRILGEPG